MDSSANSLYINILSSFTHPHVVPNMYDYLFSVTSLFFSIHWKSVGSSVDFGSHWLSLYEQNQLKNSDSVFILAHFQRNCLHYCESLASCHRWLSSLLFSQEAVLTSRGVEGELNYCSPSAPSLITLCMSAGSHHWLVCGQLKWLDSRKEQERLRSHRRETVRIQHLLYCFLSLLIPVAVYSRVIVTALKSCS